MKREEKWEILRAISCISVLLLHVAALYTEEADIYRQYAGINFSFCDFLQIMTRTAVPCFVMLSGAFLLEKQQINVASFYKLSIRKLVVPTLVFELIYMTVSICGGKTVEVVINNALDGKVAGHMWFMFMLMGLYVIFPLLHYFKQKASANTFKNFTIIMVVFSCIIHFKYNLIWPLLFLEYIGYFLMGNFLRNNGRELPGSVRTYLLISCTLLLVTLILNEYQFYLGAYSPPFYRNPNFPLVIGASLAIFIAFSKMNITHVSSYLLDVAKYSMMIYLLHPLVLNIIRRVAIIIMGQLPTPIIFVPIVFLACMKFTYEMAVVLDKFLDGVLNRVTL